MKILVTGSAGFIGYHVSQKLIEDGHTVIGIDNFNPYYDTNLKENRNNLLESTGSYKMYRGDIANLDLVKRVFVQEKFDKVIHLAAQAGVRYSIDHPHEYIESNIVGFMNVLDEARLHGVRDFMFASSGSVYGSAEKYPTDEKFDFTRPVSLYAATKGCNELLAYDYHVTFDMNCIGWRFFTVYGPWGRPDMAVFVFTDGINQGKPIPINNHGQMKRDFTYVDDIVRGIITSLNYSSGFEIFNLGSGRSVELEYYIECIEKELGQKAIKDYQPLPTGDVVESYADIGKAQEKLNYQPKTSIEQGISKYVKWYKEYYDN